MAESVDLKAINHKLKGETVLKPQYSSSFEVDGYYESP